MTTHEHSAPRDCPVCGEVLAVTRLGCPGCGTELSGRFASCPYCALGPVERDLLRVFLASRGNMKEVERFLGVSYPTARQRFADLLARLGIESLEPRPAAHVDREEVLRRLAAGELDVTAAQALLTGGGAG